MQQAFRSSHGYRDGRVLAAGCKITEGSDLAAPQGGQFFPGCREHQAPALTAHQFGAEEFLQRPALTAKQGLADCITPGLLRKRRDLEFR